MSPLRLGARPTTVPTRPRDRYWAGFRTQTTYGPLALPALDDLRAAAVLLAREWPAARIGQRFDVAAGRWTERVNGLAADAAASVVEHPHAAPARLEDVIAHAEAVQVHRPDDVAVVFVVGGPYLSVLMSHGVGDASVSQFLGPALLATATEGQVPAWVRETSVVSPLLLAVRGTVRAKVLAAVAPGPGRAAAALVRGARRGAPRPAALPPSSASSGAPARTVLPHLAVLHASMTPDRHRAVKQWRRSFSPGASMTVVHAILARTALASVGLSPVGPLTVLADVRHYLPTGTRYVGNLAIGVELATTVPWDAVALSTQLDEEVAAGRPLHALVRGEVIGTAAAWRARLLRRPLPPTPTPAWVVPDDPRPTLTVTGVGTMRVLERLPWAASPQDSTVVSMLSTGGPTAVTVATGEVQRSLQLSVSFHRSVFDADLVARAVQLMADDPVALLDAARGED